MVNTKGFTLIELLIVVSIIGILAGGVIISIGDSTDTARENTTKANVAQVARSVAVSKYLSGNNNQFKCPDGQHTNIPGSGNIRSTDNIYCGEDSDEWTIFQLFQTVTTGTDQNAWCQDEDTHITKVHINNVNDLGTTGGVKDCP